MTETISTTPASETSRTDLGLSQNDAGAGGCCGGVGCSCDSTATSTATPAAATGSVTTAAVTADFVVSGMTCGHCVSSVTEELSELAGVEAVTVDLQPTALSTVTVSSASALNVDDVRAAITEAGYDLVSPAR